MNCCLALTATVCRRAIYRRFHRVSQETLPTIISEVNSLDEFEYFSTKIRDLMDSEQLEYFENVIRKVEGIDHPITELMRCLECVSLMKTMVTFVLFNFRAKLHNPMLDLILTLTTKMVNIDKPISQKQQSLANAVQLIHLGNLVHQKGILDLSKAPNFGNDLPENHNSILGNKIALLAGDFLLANAQIKITKMR